MQIYIYDTDEMAELVLYDDSENEISESFIKYFSNNRLEKADEETHAIYGVDYIMSEDVYVMWAAILDRQQNIIDKAVKYMLHDVLKTALNPSLILTA